MRSRQDFANQEQYDKYLLHYYAGLAMQGLCSKDAFNGSSLDSVPESAFTLAAGMLTQIKELEEEAAEVDTP